MSVYKNVRLIDKEKDKSLKIDVIEGFDYAKEVTQCIVTADEIFKASRSQPVVFAKNGKGEHMAVAMMGVEEGKNLFIEENGDWKSGEYAPAYIRRYPFIFVEAGEKLALGVDEECPAVNKKKGKALFNKDGEPSEYAQDVMKFLETYQVSYARTTMFVKELDEMGLLEEANATLTIGGKKTAFTGFMRVNEAKFNQLDEEKTMKLVRSGAYKLVVAHLISMNNFDKLISYAKES